MNMTLVRHNGDV